MQKVPRMKKADRIKAALRKEELLKVKAKNRCDFFLEFSKVHRAWMKELTEAYKAHGVFPTMPIAILPSYYESAKDKEVAAFVAMTAKEVVKDTSILDGLRSMMGVSPWSWFVNRGFVRLSTGSMRDKKTSGIINHVISETMDSLWNMCRESRRYPDGDTGQAQPTPILSAIDRTARELYLTYEEVLQSVFDFDAFKKHREKIRLLILILAASDGLSLDLWDNYPQEVKSPDTIAVRRFLGKWFPGWRLYGKFDDAVRLFGLERDYDFFYSMYAFEELIKRNRKGCIRYANRYSSSYKGRGFVSNYDWTRYLPKIEFD